MTTQQRIGRLGISVVSWLVVLVFLVPLIVVLFTSIKTRTQAGVMDLSLPTAVDLSNFATVIERGKLVTTFLNSMLYATGSAVLVVVLTSMAAFVLSRNRSRLSAVLYYFIVLGIALPINYVALMQVMKFLHLINSQPGIVLLFAAINIPISLFIGYGFVSTIPKELDEAAMIDGCRPGQLFFRVIFPLMQPIAVTVFVLTFMAAWNDFIMPLYFLNSTDKWPMTLAVYNFFGMFQTQWNLVSADIVLTSAPVLVIFLLGQKYIVGGLTSGAVKG